MHTPTNYFIVNLCVANLWIMLLNTMPDIFGRIAPQRGYGVSGKSSYTFASNCLHNYSEKDINQFTDMPLPGDFS